RESPVARGIAGADGARRRRPHRHCRAVCLGGAGQPHTSAATRDATAGHPLPQSAAMSHAASAAPIVLGTPGSPDAVRLVLLGSGELGREVAIEAMRLGCEVVAVDRYPGAPAMQVAHRSHVATMTDPEALRAVLAA